MGQVDKIVGASAPEDTLEALEALASAHHAQVRQRLRCARATACVSAAAGCGMACPSCLPAWGQHALPTRVSRPGLRLCMTSERLLLQRRGNQSLRLGAPLTNLPCCGVRQLTVDVIRAYHWGARYLVEMEVFPYLRAPHAVLCCLPAVPCLCMPHFVMYDFAESADVGVQVLLPAEMTVRESHDIALMLQHKARSLSLLICLLAKVCLDTPNPFWAQVSISVLRGRWRPLTRWSARLCMSTGRIAMSLSIRHAPLWPGSCHEQAPGQMCDYFYMAHKQPPRPTLCDMVNPVVHPGHERKRGVQVDRNLALRSTNLFIGHASTMSHSGGTLPALTGAASPVAPGTSASQPPSLANLDSKTLSQ